MIRRTPALISVPLLVCTLAVGCGNAVDDESLGEADSAVKKGEGGSGGGPADKVVICHIPPGNPANAHTIVVGAPAVKAHLAHGDHLGECSMPDGATSGGGCLNGSSSSASSASSSESSSATTTPSTTTGVWW